MHFQTYFIAIAAFVGLGRAHDNYYNTDYRLSPIVDDSIGFVSSRQIRRPLGLPHIEGSLKVRGPLGGSLRARISGRLARTLGLGLRGALDRDVDVRGALTGAGLGASSSFSGSLKRGPFGLLRGSGSGKLQARLHDSFGNTLRAGLRGRLSGGVTIDNAYDNRVSDFVDFPDRQCCAVPSRCRRHTLSRRENTVSRFTFDPATQRCVRSQVVSTRSCLHSDDDVFQSQLQCEANCMRGRNLPQLPYTRTNSRY